MKRTLTFLFTLGFSFIVFSAELLNTNHIQDVAKKVKELNSTYGSKNVLVVFDIDNTVLASRKPLGSDQWFSWQEKLIFQKDNDPLKITSDFNKLLEAQGLLYYVNKMKKPEGRTTKKVIKEIQRSGNTVIALTSRGHDFKYQTIRELLRNGIDFSASSPKFINKFYKAQKAFNPKRVVKKYGFDPKKVNAFKLQKARDVQYLDGVFYTSGLHKGSMLRIFLKEAKLSPKAIVFVDDKEKHTKRVQAVFANTGIKTVTFRYTAEDKNVNTFNKSNKSKYHNEWISIKSKKQLGL